MNSCHKIKDVMKTNGGDLISRFIYKLRSFNLKRSCSFKIFRLEKMGVVGEVKYSNELAQSCVCMSTIRLLYFMISTKALILQLVS